MGCAQLENVNVASTVDERCFPKIYMPDLTELGARLCPSCQVAKRVCRGANLLGINRASASVPSALVSDVVIYPEQASDIYHSL